MNARVLQSPPPKIWTKLGQSFHQDWPIDHGPIDGPEKFRNSLVVTEDEAPELIKLIDELLFEATTNGEYARAFNAFDSDLLAGKNMKSFFEELQKALKDYYL